MLLKELKNRMDSPENLQKFNEDIDLLFPADSAQKEVLDSEYCTLDVFLNLLIKRLESVQEEIDTRNPGIGKEIAMIGALYIIVISFMVKENLFKTPDEFAEYCESFCNAAGSFREGMVKALKRGFLLSVNAYLIQELRSIKDEIIN